MNLRYSRHFVATLTAASLLLISNALPAAEPNAAAIRAELLKLHNQERRDFDQPPLSLNADLTKAAQAYAEYLAESGEFYPPSPVEVQVGGATVFVLRAADVARLI